MHIDTLADGALSGPSLLSPRALLEARLGRATLNHLRTIRRHVCRFAKEVKDTLLDKDNIESIDNFLNQNPREFIIWLSGKDISKTTWKVYENSLKTHFGVDSRHFQGVVNRNPSKKAAYELALISDVELLKIIPLLPNMRDRALLSFLYGTGGRRVSEAQFIRWVDVVVVEGGAFSFLLYKTKTTERTFKQLPIDSPFYKYFAEYWRANKTSHNTGKPLFPSSCKKNTGNFLSISGLTDLVRKLLGGQGTHSIRRAFIEDSNKKGVSLPDIGLATGHTSTSTITYKYLRTANEANLFRQHKAAQSKTIEDVKDFE